MKPSKRSKAGAACLLISLLSGCGRSGIGEMTGAGDDDDAATPRSRSPAAPRLLSSSPVDGAIGVPRDTTVAAVFSQTMDPDTLTESTFTLTSGTTAVAIDGNVLYADKTAVFWPTGYLASNRSFIATITTAVMNASDVPMPAKRVWSFTTGTTLAALPVELGTAANYVILTKTGITAVPTVVITGDLGTSPIASGAITGFALVADATNEFSTSAQVTGKVYAADHEPPTPDTLGTAVLDMQAAFLAAAGRSPDVTALGGVAIGGLVITQGVYRWTTALSIPTDVTLSGSATDVWIFQVADALTMTSDAKVILTGGARAENVFWQVTGAVNLGTDAHLEGVVLTAAAVTLGAGASINGRLLAQTAVNLDSNTIAEPIAPIP